MTTKFNHVTIANTYAKTTCANFSNNPTSTRKSVTFRNKRNIPTPNAQRPTPNASPTRSAFTLVEVTISVAIAVVLMLGIAQVFKVVGDTVGTGEALATTQRDARATQAVFAHDFNTAVTDTAPFMLLNSQATFAFRNQADLLASKTGNPAEYDPYNTGTESFQPVTNYNYRSHRTDCLTIFGRGSFSRQTGADVPSSGYSPFVSTMGGMEAMLWYGHLNLADNNGSFTTTGNLSNNSPGVGTSTVGQSTYYNTINPNNYFATSWILGRQQIILQPPSTLDNNNATFGASGNTLISKIVDQNYPNGNEQYAYMQTAIPLSPLSAASVAYKSSAPGTGSSTLILNSQPGTPAATLLSSRIDLAGTSLLGFRNTATSYIYGTPSPYPLANPNWWSLLPTGIGGLRFQAQPFFLTKPPTPETMAYQSPIFVRGCTQFTVEYAGDYLNQDPTTGAVTDTYAHVTGLPPNETAVTPGTTDGQIDYIPETTGGVSGQNLIRKIRWYGLPRSTTNNASINYTNGDVTPLRDVWVTASNGSQGSQAPFEVAVPVSSSDYSKPTTLAPYICAWGPSDPKPKMIRITLTIDDPGGRLGDGQTYEYIYTLP